MRKLIDTLAVASFLVSAAVVGTGVYVYVNKDALIEQARERAIENITPLIGDAVAGLAIGGLAGDDLPGVGAELPATGGGAPVPEMIVPF